MVRAHFKSRPSREDSPAIPHTHPTPDLNRDGDTPSLPSWGRRLEDVPRHSLRGHFDGKVH